MNRLQKFGVFMMFVALTTVAVGLMSVQPEQSPEDLKEKYTDALSKFIKVGDLDVHYLDEGRGPTVLLLHGLGGSADDWRSWIAGARQHFRMIAVTVPGFGLTGPFVDTPHYNLTNYLLFIREFLQTLGITRVYIVGHSFGALLGWNYSIRFPEMVGGLALMAPLGIPGSSRLPINYLLMIPSFDNIITKITPKGMIRAILNVAFMPQSDLITPDLVDRYYALNHRRGNRAELPQIMKIAHMGDAQDLARVQVPTLVQWGEGDRIIPVSYAREFARMIPGAKLLIYKGSGHMINLAIPRQSALDVIEFVSAQSLRP